MATLQISPASRSELSRFLTGGILRDKFHNLFQWCDEENIKNKKLKNDKRKGKKKSKSKSKEKKNKQRDKSPESTEIHRISVDLYANPSLFTVYAAVRQTVLEQCMNEATQIYHESVSPATDSDSDEEGEEKSKELAIKLPKIVGLGLCGVFELIRETRNKYPELCIKALRALLDLLQGQFPESMKTEPLDVVSGLFELLMELTCNPSPDPDLPSLACSSLISLVIALGDTSKMLTAVSAILMNPRPQLSHQIMVPGILTLLQRSVQAVLLGKSALPDWFSQGIKTAARIDKFPVEALMGYHHTNGLNNIPSAIACDGQYLYLLNSSGLFKVGSGYGSTIKGHVYQHREDFPVTVNVWLAYAGGKLFCRSDDNAHPQLCVVDPKSLEVHSACKLDGKSNGPSALFSDGEYIGQIVAAKDDTFVVRMFDPNKTPMTVVNEIPLKLTRKCLEVLGQSGYDNEINRHPIVTFFDEESACITAGKEFALIRTVGGKVIYTGKSQCLGIKQGGPAQGKWAELPITKSPKIVQVVTGHEGLHALMVAEDGSVFFVGTSRRGEDGDASVSKARRQPKAVKPRKMIRIESRTIVYAACNNGSSAVVTREGQLFIFGKDTTFCDQSSGLVTELKKYEITQVALGKAHVVALSGKGQVFTFGINNKGQCGRDFPSAASREVINNVTMADEEEETEPDENICPPGKHRWKHDRCMLCSVCGKCTGYGVDCVHQGQGDRNPGTECGCGAGDSGCSECGICRNCAVEVPDMDGDDIDRQILEKSKELLSIDLMLGKNVPSHLEQFFKSLDATHLKKKLLNLKGGKNKKDMTDQEADYTKSSSLPPTELDIGRPDNPAVQIACGQHHTVVLLQNGEVYTFGSNQYGQLGQGDTSVKGCPVLVPLHHPAVQVAAGSHHTVVLLNNGQVYTFGNHEKHALGRAGPDEAGAMSKKAWYAVPGPVPSIGARYGRRATWIGASGDQTFLRIDESLINAHILAASKVFANQKSIGLIPIGEENTALMKCLMISKVDGSCRSLGGAEQDDLSKHAVCLDPVYDVLWSYLPSSHEVTCYNCLASEARTLTPCDLFKPELAVPVRTGCNTTRSHCALHMLGCLDVLTMAQKANLTVVEETKEKQTTSKVYTKDDFTVVNRFESHGGGWGYSGHSIEAVRFMSDTDILLGGFGLFGGRGEYYGRIKLFDLGPDGGDNEGDGELIGETDEVAFECGAREKHAMLFDEPIPIHANSWYVAWARISGPSSDCGSTGQSMVTTEDQVVFKFKSSKKSNNGTDVNAGQIPQLLYRLPSRDSPGTPRKVDHTEAAHILSSEFSCSVSPDNFEALQKLLEWSWTSFNTALLETDGLKGDNLAAALADIQRLVYITRACLRLIKTYVTQIYPNGASSQKAVTETVKLAECIGDTQDLLKTILADEVKAASKVKMFLTEPGKREEFLPLKEEILKECHQTFCACFHAFFPTGNLKWHCLCDLLIQLEPDMVNVSGYSRLLAAVMEAMCHPTIKITSIMPINCQPATEEILRRQSDIMDDNTNSVARMGEVHRFPILVSHMTSRVEALGLLTNHVTFREILDKLLSIVTLPVRQALSKETSTYPSILVANTCSLLATIISELSATATGLEMDHGTATRPLLVTPNRFTRTSQHAMWNSGNGSPDAITFSVDKPGILIAGVCVYGGDGQYNYELEFLDDQGDGLSNPSPSQRWNVIESVKGVYGHEDCVNDIAEIKFDRPIAIKEGVKYTVRLKNHGSMRTLNGDGGVTKVRCPDGTNFTFQACSLSSNGTNHMRGQIPQILYYSAPQEGENYQSNKSLAELQARKNAIDIVSAICRVATDVLRRAQFAAEGYAVEVLGVADIFCSLLPLILAYIGPVASQDPRGAVQILGIIQEILPEVAQLNTQSPAPLPAPDTSENGTTSQHYAVVESDHPYKPASVSNYKVIFPESVKWMVLEFDPQCGTAQAEDTLQLYIPAGGGSDFIPTDSSSEEGLNTQNYWPMWKKFHGSSNWPKTAIVLPGHEVVFSLETASDYVKDDKSCFFGFKCVVVGYEWNFTPDESVTQLERELSYLGGMCAASLIKKDVALPPVTVEELEEDMEYIEEGSQLIFSAHSELLGKGFALSHPPTIMQALEGNLPFCWQSNERSFLKDFVACNPGTSGGRLARWLQPDSYLDPSQCELMYSKEDLRCGWPALITVLTKDQYGQLVHVPNLKVNVKAVPIDQGISGDERRLRRLSRPDEGDKIFGGHPPPPQDIPYEATVRERKDIFHAISMMKAYENYSFEELRYAAPAVPRPSENMLVRCNSDGTYVANWTPSNIGLYKILVTIDDFDTGEIYKLEVKDPPQGVTPPTQTEKKPHQPNKMRKFVAKFSAGLRIRVNPSLQSEYIGVIQPEGIISFVDEIHNDDGVWLRLSQASINEWCKEGHVEGWALQYNQHLGKTLLVPVEEPKPLMEEIIKETIRKNLHDVVKPEVTPKRGPGEYQVVKCGPSGHNIRCRPHLKATPIGMLIHGEKITVVEDVTNEDGRWVRLDPESVEQYCQNKQSEAWVLVSGRDGTVYLKHESDLGGLATGKQNDPFAFNSLPPSFNKGFDFSPQMPFVFGSPPSGPFGRSASLPSNVLNPGFSGPVIPTFGNPSSLQFGGFGSSFESSPIQRDMTKVNTLPGSLSASPGFLSPSRMDISAQTASPVSTTRSPASGSPKSSRREISHPLPVELQGVSVKELVKALGESRANGNGPTPVPSPPGTPKKSGSRSSSPHLTITEKQGSPRTGSPVGRLSPRQTRASSLTDSPSHNSIKEDLFATPPDSPIAPIPKRVSLKKEVSSDRPTQSPPTSPSLKHKQTDVSKIAPPSGQGILSPVRRDSFGGHVSPVRSTSPQRRASSPLLTSQSRASPVNAGSRASPLSANARSSPVNPGARASPGTGGSPIPTFSIGSSSPKEESRMSPKSMRKDRGRSLRSKRSDSPSSRDSIPIIRARSSSTSVIYDKKEPVKEALSPSVAECLRAVFAAFLWHEGIVHDAMACASFLKFHPDLQKEMSKFANRAKPEKMRVRHATDSSKDINKKKENININESRVRFKLDPRFVRSDSEKSDKSDKSDKEESSKGVEKAEIQRTMSDGRKIIEARQKKAMRHKSEGNVGFFKEGIEPDKDSPLPPTLHHLVYFWEEMSSGVLKVIDQKQVNPSPAVMLKAKKSEKREKEKEKDKKASRKKKDEIKHIWRGNAMGDMMMGPLGGRDGGDRGETQCELCGGMFPHPVTYHMRQAHPGCGRHAGGKGYNSSGIFCGGWAGNCGEGGLGGSSWYLICEKCREKCLKEKRHSQREKDKAKKQKKKSSQNRQQTVLYTQESHAVLKSNAMFLLDLASASGLTLPIQSKKLPQSRSDLLLPSVSEEYGMELNPFPPVPFQFLALQGGQNADSAFAEEVYIDADERVFVRSGSMSIRDRQPAYRPRLPTEPRHSPLARSGSLGQDSRSHISSHISPPSPRDFNSENANHETKQIPKSAGTSPDSSDELFGKSRAFQRSLSEIVPDDGKEQENDKKMLSGRRRNNSGGVGDGGMSLLKHPSAAMEKLLHTVDRKCPEDDERALQRPVMSFITQRHDLEGLQLAMKQALRKAACRVFAMQALNWLLRSITQTVCLHDLLWFFVSSLMPTGGEEEEQEEEEEDKDKEKKKKDPPKKDHEDVPLCDHPLSDITIAGSAVEPLPEVFHMLLQTIADAMMFLPWGSALQQVAVRCWCLKFQPSDHQFLHECHVFSNISRILSKSEEEREENTTEAPQSSVKIYQLKDLTPSSDISVSSRQAMIASLTDNSTETFWESGDEDRNRSKFITIKCHVKASARIIYVHIDNARDLGSKVGSLSFSVGPSPDDLKKFHQVDVESRYVGWLSCQFSVPHIRVIQLEMKGPDHSLRVRQIKILGEMEGQETCLPIKKSAVDMQKENCESETLRVFRMLTSQVFGKLITLDGAGKVKLVDGAGGDSLDGDHDLKEHMVGILFSRSKLSHLQRQVCSHIVQGIRKESTKIREEWEASLLNPNHIQQTGDQDVYCFELLSMVLALSGSSVGRAYLAQQYPLLQDLFSLLHTGTPRVQRQVISVLRRVLQDVKPQTLSSILSVPALPPVEYSIVSLASRDESVVFDPEQPGLLDVLLACISKALTVQTKIKISGPQKTITAVKVEDCLGSTATKSRWWFRGRISESLANNVITLIQDMASGQLSETWAPVTKAAIAESILNLTKLGEKYRDPQVCLKTPTLWLCLASLCVLDKDHVERLTSGQWISSPNGQHGQPRPTCDNHDDGETQAIILCSECGNLCADCDRFLHLPRNKRSHQRQVFKEEEEAIKVDLHEGCGRTKLFWVMALADSKALKAMVEFREGKSTAATSGPGRCRFCGTTSKTGVLAVGNVCSDPECQEHAKNACQKVLACGHQCGGIANEEECLPCLHNCPPYQDKLKQDADDMCMICFTEALSAAPAIQLKCKHVFHLHCSRNILEKRWVGPRITFGFSLCPICKNPIDHPVLKELLKPIRDLFSDVKRKALMRLEYEGLHKAEAITTPGARFYKDPAGFAMDRYAYYVCFKCKKAYYGGEARCDEQIGVAEDYDPRELVCGGCSDVSRAQMCPKHGTDFLEYKCRYCCSVAVFFCFGTTHFCNACHDDFQRVTSIAKTELPHCPAGPRGKQLEGEECPLHVQHPPTGEEFALGCGVCRNAHTF
ncbi:E3 ubiquitin-protein ligase MYCBP2-like [Saccostrea cucullata]|uniref:E3 ubiquitin-protein ligase MYCBP2-like n=1 Tax=Saccostrea cuccullata TaxID=36930 RepID=UPI002ED32489